MLSLLFTIPPFEQTYDNTRAKIKKDLDVIKKVIVLFFSVSTTKTVYQCVTI
jgi:hypothetical protein